MVAKRIKLGRRAELPLCALGGYIAAGALLCFGSLQEFGESTRGPLMFAAVIAFLAGGVIHILDKIGLHNEEVLAKIDDSVGDVYDEGERAGVRHEMLAAAAADTQLAIVHDLSPR